VEAVTQPHLETIDSDQCAELLRCTPGQVEEMARAGEIPGLKIGRGWLFVRADLRVALDAYRRVISEKP
jgi:excisionase family DNA binding protein